jgi:hypothetical protein
LPLSKFFHECLIAKIRLAAIYEQLADNSKAYVEQQLLQQYAVDEKYQFENLCSIYEELVGQPFTPPALPRITIENVYSALLDCIAKEFAVIDNYKCLWYKLQALEHRNLIQSFLHSDIRHSYGLLVLITPEDKALDPLLPQDSQ